MTLWYDPNVSLRDQCRANPTEAGERLYEVITDFGSHYVRVQTVHGGLTHCVQLTSLPAVGRLLNRIGWGLRIDRYHDMLWAVRRAPLLNEAVVNNKAAIKDRLRRARRELTEVLPLWESVARIRPVVLDKRMVQALVNMAAGWPEVMHVAYDGASFESFDGVHKAPENSILIRFWPVCFQQGLGTMGLSAVADFTIGSNGHTSWSNGLRSVVHPHFFRDGNLCQGTAERAFTSQIQSLATLRDWWVGTDHHPADANWADKARQWWDSFGEQFFAYFEGGKPHMYPEVAPKAYDDGYVFGSGVRFVMEDIPVTDDGLGIPGLSLPEYTVSHGPAYYIVAPEISEGYDVDAEDQESEASLLTLTRENLEGLLNEYNIDARFNCYICGTHTTEQGEDRFYCDYCGHYVCEDHYHGEDICDTCHAERYTTCDHCGKEISRGDAYSCDTCDDDLCDDCVVERGGDYYCTKHAPEEDDEEDDDPDEALARFTTDNMPEIAVGYRCTTHGNIGCRICAAHVVGLTREIFQPETNTTAGYICEVNIGPTEMDYTQCGRRAPWRRMAYTRPGWLCEDHYQAMAVPTVPTPPVMEPTQYPVAARWARLIEVRHNIVCCHPECLPLGTEAIYTNSGHHIWPQTPRFIGEYACEAHVPRVIPAAAGWRMVETDVPAVIADDYEFVGTGDQWQCEWPSHVVYMQAHPDQAHWEHARCLHAAPWRHHNGDFGGEYPQPHYLCDAHHVAVLNGGYHTLVNAAVAQEETTNGD